MIGRLVAKLVVVLLRNSRIDVETRQLLTAALLDKLGALPVRARITVDPSGVISFDGKQVSHDVAIRLRDGSRALLNNFARKVVRETVTFMAIKQGVHENLSPEQGLFAKAILWVMQEEDDLFRRCSLDSTE